MMQRGDGKAGWETLDESSSAVAPGRFWTAREVWFFCVALLAMSGNNTE